MTQGEYLDLEDVLSMVRLLGVGPVRDIGLLDSAINRPRASAGSVEFYPTLRLKEAALLQSLVKNHALVDGNKRLGWLATVVFCDLNGAAPVLSDDEVFQLVQDVASTNLDLEHIAERLQIGDQRLHE